jgi:hypothetical protein
LVLLILAGLGENDAKCWQKQIVGNAQLAVSVTKSKGLDDSTNSRSVLSLKATVKLDVIVGRKPRAHQCLSEVSDHFSEEGRAPRRRRKLMKYIDNPAPAVYAKLGLSKWLSGLLLAPAFILAGLGENDAKCWQKQIVGNAQLAVSVTKSKGLDDSTNSRSVLSSVLSWQSGAPSKASHE